jgi:hypothetical protein
MSLDLLSSIHTKTSCRIALQQPDHHAPSFGGHIRREVERVGEDALIHRVDILVVEWGEAGLGKRYQYIWVLFGTSEEGRPTIIS